jgi:hypothetical protein
MPHTYPHSNLSSQSRLKERTSRWNLKGLTGRHARDLIDALLERLGISHRVELNLVLLARMLDLDWLWVGDQRRCKS